LRTQKIRNRLLSTTMIGGFAALAFAAPAMAQDAGASQDLDDVIVTGSRIPQTNLVTTSPVTQVTGEDIDVAGVTRVEDLIAQLPQAFAAQNSTVSNGASGTATVSLRNLGSSRTLVLIDGRRMGYGSPNDDAADLNQIPEQLVERVEVLTGGASAVYGSDAVAGVVNFIMKKDFEGLQIDAQYGFYQHNNDYDGVGNLRAEIARRALTNAAQFQLPDDNVSDGESRSLNVTLGVSSPDGRGNVMAYAGYRNNNPILQRDRDYSACALGAPNAGSGPNTYSCGGSGTSFPGQFTDFSTFAYTVGAGRTFVPYDGNVNAYNFGPLNYYQRPDERYTLGAFGRYEVNDKAEVFAQLMFSDYSSVAQIAPSGSFFSTGDINCDSPLLSAQQSAAIGCTAGDILAGTRVPMYIARRNVEGGGRQDSLNYTSYRGVAGVRGEITTGWNYDIAAQFSRVRLARTYLNDFSVTRLLRAVDVVNVGGTPTCRSVVNGTDPNCVPYDVFGNGTVTQAALDYLQIPLIQTGETTQQVVTAAITGDTGWSMPTASRTVQVAFGAEYRRDALASTTDAAFASGDGAGQGGPTIGITGDADVAEVFGEIQIPLADDQPWAYSASIDAAYRRSEYENIGTDTYKVGADYAPIEDIRFRASYSRAVRAPNVIELFAAQGFNLFDADNDPCDDLNDDGVLNNSVPAACIGAGSHQVTLGQSDSGALNSPAGQYNFLGGGNPNLNPEEADTYTYGVVWTPSFVPGFNISVDYFDIQVDGLISTVGALNTFDLCYNQADAAACGRINRNAGGQLWVGSGFVEDLNNNIGGLATSGIDVNSNYAFDLEDMGMANMGSMQLSFVGTYLSELITDTGLGGPASVYDCTGFYANQCGVPNPEWRHRARATWLTPWDVDLSATWRHYGEVELAVLNGTTGTLNNGGARLDRYFDAENYLDLAAVWGITDTVTLRAGVNNVLDNDPQLSYSVGTTGNGNTYPQLYDAMGRYFFFGVTANF
jgi:iron complex outermembrane receptor protein